MKSFHRATQGPSLLHLSLLVLTLVRVEGQDMTPDPCNGNSTLGLKPITCGSCRGRCRTLAKDGTDCACDATCVLHGTCCPDFPSNCPQEYSNGTIIQEDKPRISTSSFICAANLGSKGDSDAGSVRMVGRCADGSMCETSREFLDLRQRDVTVPVVETSSGLHYVNSRCARCNAVQSAEPWKLSINCPQVKINRRKLESLLMATSNSSQSEALEALKMAKCKPVVSPVWKHTLHRCLTSFIIASCPDTCNNTDLTDKCLTYGQDIVQQHFRGVYKNYYCAVCNIGSIDSRMMRCGILKNEPAIRKTGDDEHTGKVDLESFSLSLLLDYSPSGDLVVEDSSINCLPIMKGTTAVWVDKEDQCREFRCEPGFESYQGHCIPDNSTHWVDSTTSMVFTIHSCRGGDQLNENLKNKLKKGIESHVEKMLNISCSKYIFLQEVLEFGNCKIQRGGVTTFARNISFVYEMSCQYTADYNHTLFDTDVRDIEGITQDVIVTYISSAYKDVTIVQNMTTVTMGGHDIDRGAMCGNYAYKVDEVVIDNLTQVLTVIDTNDTYLEQQYVQGDAGKQYWVCRNISLNGTNNNSTTMDRDDDNDTATGLAVLTIVLGGLSVICLGIRLMLQPFDKRFQTFPGIMQFNLVLALFIAFVTFFLSPFLRQFLWPCNIVGAVKHFGFLASFFWMNIIAIDTWWIFKPGNNLKSIKDSDRKLWPLVLYGWICPLVIAIIALILENQNVDSRFQANYRRTSCWFSERLALIVFFAIPGGILVVANVLLFIATSVVLSRSFRQPTSKIKGEDQLSQHGVYLRLFVLMGVSWVFLLMAGFVQNIGLQYISVILNASQGIFIFIFFVLTKDRLARICRSCRCHWFSKRFDQPTSDSSSDIKLSSVNLTNETKSSYCESSS